MACVGFGLNVKISRTMNGVGAPTDLSKVFEFTDTSGRNEGGRR